MAVASGSTWPWIGSYWIPSCITRRPLPIGYVPNFIEIEQTFFVDGGKVVRTHGRTFETGFIRSTIKSRPNNNNITKDRLKFVDHGWFRPFSFSAENCILNVHEHVPVHGPRMLNRLRNNLLIVGRISNKIGASDAVAVELQSDLNAFMICGFDKQEHSACSHSVSACQWIRAAIVCSSLIISGMLRDVKRQ